MHTLVHMRYIGYPADGDGLIFK